LILIVLGQIHFAVPGFETFEHLVALLDRGPHRFALLEPDFVVSFADALFVTRGVVRA